MVLFLDSSPSLEHSSLTPATPHYLILLIINYFTTPTYDSYQKKKKVEHKQHPIESRVGKRSSSTGNQEPEAGESHKLVLHI
jgi:hypothetical protein